MTIKGLFATAAAMALMSTGTLAAAAPVANPAASLSIAPAARTGSPSAHGSRIGASVTTTTLISIGILAALTAIVLVATRNSDSSPKSP